MKVRIGKIFEGVKSTDLDVVDRRQAQIEKALEKLHGREKTHRLLSDVRKLAATVHHDMVETVIVNPGESGPEQGVRQHNVHAELRNLIKTHLHDEHGEVKLHDEDTIHDTVESVRTGVRS